MNQRSPRIGDMIIRKISLREHVQYTWLDLKDNYTGLVYEFCPGSAFVFIEWANGEAPPDYNSRYGYSPTNIHNLYRKFDIVRDGKFVS